MIIIIALLLLAFYFYLGVKRPGLAFLTCPLPALFLFFYFAKIKIPTSNDTFAIVIMLRVDTCCQA